MDQKIKLKHAENHSMRLRNNMKIAEQLQNVINNSINLRKYPEKE